MFKNYEIEQYKTIKDKFMSQYDKLNKTHNILVMVGNGFDIACLNNFRSKQFPNLVSSYSNFYQYLELQGRILKDNYIYKQMSLDKNKNKENWSDFENSIATLYCDVDIDNVQLTKDLDDIRNEFSYYLNELIDYDIVKALNNDSSENKRASITLSSFLFDVDGECGAFNCSVDHGDLINFKFLNFNYTFLLDNYLCLDKRQFDPHKYSVSDRNLSFHTLTGFWGNEWIPSAYLMLKVEHPNGVQHIPRSYIFGTEAENYPKWCDDKFLIKSFVGQYDRKYFDYFDNVEVFIIFGMSLGASDSWWYKNIFHTIMKNQSHLLIYFYGKDISADEIKNKFIHSAVTDLSLYSEFDLEDIKRSISVVIYDDDSKIKFLSFHNNDFQE
ncbi:MAG: AbiH family protein [Coriobacteriia bacterium]|nr:AbiH family protein [Coriobacteriia bacterium]